MKNLYYLFFLVLFIVPAFADAQVKKCITQEKMEQLFQADPHARNRFENTQLMLEEKVNQILSNQAKQMQPNAIMTIPVVIHIMYQNPTQVTDATVQTQLDTLNKYYSGGSATDSLRVYAPFRTTYGRSQIRFCKAQRTPSGQPTDGITRTVSSFDPNGSTHPSSVVPAWNTQLYLNIWVVNFGSSGTLGYSMLPGSLPPGDGRAGFVVDYRAFGANAPYLFSQINQGKTAVHEIGHFFNLLHPWGGNNSGNPTCTLDDGCSDTPLTSGPTGGCPNGPVTNTCSPSAPGVMWQNHMDYADDACMLLFTAQQTLRMETALMNAPDRSTLLSSNGCSPAAAPANDASISAIVSPAQGNTTCSSSVAPVVTLKNIGTNTLTSATINYTVNGTPATPFTWTGSLVTGATVNISLPAVNLNSGNNTITVSSSLPNGVADGDPTNDSKTVTVTYVTLTNLPLIQNFEGSFPPALWTVYNPNGDFTWQKVTPGKNSSFSMFINNYDDDATNNIDEFRSYPISTTGLSSLIINFDLAHKNYPSTGYHDTLTVLVSNDCGATYQPVYKKWGSTLATAGSSDNAYTSPAPSDWRNESIAISGPILSSGQLMVAFRNTTRWGNNIFIDNINIVVPGLRDIKLNSILQPTALSCSQSVSPQITVNNPGQEIITSFKIGYRIGNGPITLQTFNQTINPGETIALNLGNITANPGNNTITIFAADPVSASGTGDVNASNDTLTRGFAIAGNVQAPLVESFTGSDFPPANWAVINEDGQLTWERYANGNGNAGSAFVNTFNYPAAGQRDMLVTPMISYGNVDSVKLSFDLAASPSGVSGPIDTLEILISRDCGNTFTSVYKKWGADLKTTDFTSMNEFFPTSSDDWRKENIDLSQFVAQSPIMVLFTTSNNNENNIFIDNVNLSTVTLPAALKQQGYLVVPTLFNGSFTVWHYQQPSTLRYINVYNIVGQLVWKKEYSGNAGNREEVNLMSKAPGVYIVQIGYTNKKEIVQRVIKQ